MLESEESLHFQNTHPNRETRQKSRRCCLALLLVLCCCWCLRGFCLKPRSDNTHARTHTQGQVPLDLLVAFNHCSTMASSLSSFSLLHFLQLSIFSVFWGFFEGTGECFLSVPWIWGCLVLCEFWWVCAAFTCCLWFSAVLPSVCCCFCRFRVNYSRIMRVCNGNSGSNFELSVSSVKKIKRFFFFFV